MRETMQYKINMVVALGVLVVLLSLLFSTGAQAAEAFFSWTPNEITPKGYRIHYGIATRNYDQLVDVGLPEIADGRMVGSVDTLQEGITYYFAATAYIDTEESDYSTEVVYTVPFAGEIVPEAPMAFGFNKVVLYTSDGTKKITIDADGTITIEDL